MSHLPTAKVPVFGESAPSSTPKYWKADAVASDNGIAFLPVWEWQELVPEGLHAEAAFRALILGIGHTIGGTFKVTARVDGLNAAQAIPIIASSVLESVPMLFILPQQAAEAELRLTSLVIPLVQRVVRGGLEVARWYRRGVRCSCKIEAVAALGTGILRLEAAAVDVLPLRRSVFTETAVVNG